MKKLKTKVKKIVGEKNLEFLKHSKNYMSAEFFSKALVFVSIPIFTRLLTPDEYGILSVFTSLISIMTIFLGLNVHGGIKRYYFEETGDFNKLLGSNIGFISLFDFLFVIIIFYFRRSFARFIGISEKVFFLAVLTAGFMVAFKILLTYLQGKKESKIYSIITVLKSSFILVLAIILMIIFKEDKYMGKIYSQLIITGLFSIYSYISLIKISDFSFQWKYIKYTLSFGVPLIPHALSGFILAYFDRIIIQQLTNSTSTGLYSFAYNVGMIMNVIVLATSKSWQPIFYEAFGNQNYERINKMAYDYSKYIYLAAIGLIFFSKEIVMILADNSYYKALNLVPVIVLGYVFVFLYTLYVAYSLYRKKTGLVSMATMIAGAINIVLNYLLIPSYGYQIAAYTTLLCYSLLLVMHYINVKFILKEKVISLINIFPNFLLIVFLTFLFMFIKINLSYGLVLLFKLIILILSIYWFLIHNNN